MKTLIASIVLALVAAPVWAGDSPVSELARQSGLSERKVQMIVGNRSAYAEYPYTYQRSLEKFVATIGQDNYDRLMSGDAVALLDAQGRVLVVQLRNGRLERVL